MNPNYFTKVSDNILKESNHNNQIVQSMLDKTPYLVNESFNLYTKLWGSMIPKFYNVNSPTTGK
jgi:hypothetical protein